MGDEHDPDGGKGREAPKAQRTLRKEDWDGPTVALDLPRGNRIEIRLRSKVTSGEFEQIRRVYDLSELSFVDQDGEEETT